jgi:CubicO group peptidase (beta-lactamase class C family)
VVVHRPQAATGDPELAAAVDQVTGRRTRRLAAVTLDLSGSPRRRMAFIDADAHTRFEIGSIGKGLTGLLVADSVARGEITMASTLGRLSGRYLGTPLESVSVEQLCTHTSGLPPLPRSAGMLLRGLAGVWFGIDPYRGITAVRVARDAIRQRLDGTSRYAYSNLGAAVLGNAIAEHVGSAYPGLLSKRLFTPLAMTESSAAREPGRAVSRGWTAGGRRPFPWRPSGYAPAGDVTSTATDMAALAEALLEGRAPGAAAMSALPGYQMGHSKAGQAMFWIVNTVPGSDRTEVWHNGQTGGYSAFFAVYPQTHRAVVVMADVADAGDQQRIAKHLIRWIVTTAQGSTPG